MNDKGFTLIEVLGVIVIISIVSFVVVKYVGNTLSAGKEESYKLMKDNIVSVAKDYVLECNNSFVDCDLNWVDNEVDFSANVLKNSGYFDNLVSPIDGKELGECLVITASINNGVVNTYLTDSCY